MCKTFYLGVSKFGVLSFCSFRTENSNAMPILPNSKTKTASFWKQYSFGVRDKIGITKDFLYGMGKVREN